MFKLISVHIPKTAGQTFEEILRGTYGPSFLRDNVDLKGIYFSLETNVLNYFDDYIYNQTEIVHGHFRACKYNQKRFGFPPLITWMRNPVDRVISQFFYDKHNLISGGSESIHKSVPSIINDNDDLSNAVLEYTKLYSNYVSNCYIDIPITDFSFVGFMERFDEDIEKLNNKFELNLNNISEIRVFNKTPDKEEIENKTKKEMENYLLKDLRLYDIAINNFF